MNAITIPKLSERAIALLSERARLHGASIEAEVAEIVEVVVRATREPAWRLASADRIAAMAPNDVVQIDSTESIREDRNR